MAKSKRALRRHHRARMLTRAENMLKDWGEDKSRLTWRAIRMYNNMQNCSCSMCCNERSNPWLKNYDRLTMQEKKALDNYKDQIDGYFQQEEISGSPTED